MSRQNKNTRKKLIAKQVTLAHSQGNKVPFTTKKSSVNKGKCHTVSINNMHVRRSITSSKQGV